MISNVNQLAGGIKFCNSRIHKQLTRLAMCNNTGWVQFEQQTSISNFSSAAQFNEYKNRMVGKTLFDSVTPALFVDLNVFEQNCNKLKIVMKQFPAVNIRPHTKAHKNGLIAKMQLDILGDGAQGVCCQTVAEAEEMVRGGIKDVFISNQTVGVNKILRMARLAAQGASVIACVDDEQNLRSINSCARALNVQIGVIIECNVGQNRCGVQKADEAVSLAKLTTQLSNTNFIGLQGYHGKLQHVRDPTKRKEAVEQVVSSIQQFKEAVEKAGCQVNVVTGGGSGTYRIEAHSQIFTEVQPGSFCFGDVDYSKNLQSEGGSEWDFALFVLATVISRNVHLSQVVLDAGSKAVSYDSGPPVVKAIHDQEQQQAYGLDEEHLEAENGGDEHTIIHWPSTWQTGHHDLPAVGSHVILVPGHCDPTLNLYDTMLLVRDGIIEDVVQIRARGPGC